MKRIYLDIQRFADGKVVIDTELNTKNFESGLDKIKNTTQNAGSTVKNIVTGLGITKLISSAMGQINASLDGAINRIDTFNQYPKVLSNFGVSAEEASASIERIDQSVRGLPTSLDQAVAGVQNIFMVTKDLGEAEKLFKAINDSAMVFANGSTEAVDRFSYAFKQAMSSGKVSAQDFNQMNEAIPGLMDKVAESMGKTYAELKEGLSNGDIAMTEFNDALKKLDTEGGAGMASLEKSAKTATGGIKTSMANAKTAITRGVASIIDMLNQSFGNTEFGSLGGFIESVGKKIESILKQIAPYISYLASNLKTIIPLVSTLVVGFATIKPDGILKDANALGGLVGKISSSAGLVTKIVSSGFGFAALGGLILVAMGLAQDNFGEGLTNMLDTAIEKGPEIITNLINGIVSKLPDLIQKGGELLSKLLETINANLPAIIKGGMEIISALVIGLAQQLPTLIPQVIEIIMTIVENLIDNIDLLIDAAIELIIGLAEGLIQALPILIEKIPIIIDKLITKLTDPEMIGKLIQAAARLVTELAIGLVMAIPDLLKGVAKLCGSILEGLWNLIKSVPEIGINVVKGIWDGIKNSLKWIKDKIKEWIGNVVDFIKKIFKIGSPSKLMRDEIGIFVAQGIGVGFEEELDDVYKGMQKTIDFENAKLQANVESGRIFNTIAHSTPVEINLDASVDLDGQKVGRLVTPSVARTIKTGGGY